MAIGVVPYEREWRERLCQIWFDSFESAGLSHSPDTTVETLMTRLDAEIAGGWRVFCALDGRTLLGFLAYDPGKQYLNQLFLDRQAQARGVGKTLLNFAKLQMPDGFRLRTHADNTGAQRFYEREEMIRETTERHPRFGHLTHIYRWEPVGAPRRGG